MKKMAIRIFLLVWLLSGCTANKQIEEITAQPFDPYCSYEEVLQMQGQPGVRTDGFVNTQECLVQSAEDAVEQAKKECTVTYNCISYAYCEEDDIWIVMFHTEDMLGGDQEVYLGSDGLTKLIIYGE